MSFMFRQALSGMACLSALQIFTLTSLFALPPFPSEIRVRTIDTPSFYDHPNLAVATVGDNTNSIVLVASSYRPLTIPSKTTLDKALAGTSKHPFLNMLGAIQNLQTGEIRFAMGTTRFIRLVMGGTLLPHWGSRSGAYVRDFAPGQGTSVTIVAEMKKLPLIPLGWFRVWRDLAGALRVLYVVRIDRENVVGLFIAEGFQYVVFEGSKEAFDTYAKANIPELFVADVVTETDAKIRAFP